MFDAYGISRRIEWTAKAARHVLEGYDHAKAVKREIATRERNSND